jgi:DNA-binding transcriptional LysR family regulator
MDIRFELYKIFYYVAKTLSFSEAASQLFISQSAVSQGIKSLERQMDCQLFNRSTKQVQLTKEGHVLFLHIEQAFNFIKKGERNIYEMRTLEQGEIRIGASDTICKYYLLPFFKQFIALYPNIKIHITNRPSATCIELLKQGTIDFAAVNLPSKLSSGMTVEIIQTLQDVFIAAPAFTFLQNKKIPIDQLKQYPLLLLEKKTSTRAFLESFLSQHQIHITPEIELSSVELLVEMTKIGLGISFVMKKAVEKELSTGELFVLDLDTIIPTREIAMITHQNIPLPTAALKFIELCTRNSTSSHS